ncbi:MAG: SseB family protein [Pseudomonadota bacterium]
MNPLDEAFVASREDPDNDALQMRYYATLADTEVFLLLTGESDGTTAEPMVVDPGSGPMALAFDDEARLADFTGETSPFLAVSGRQAAELLSSSGLGLAFNLDTPFETAFDTETLLWLAGVSGETEEQVATPKQVLPPKDLPEDLLAAIDRKLAMAAGYASQAVLADAVYDDGSRAHLLAVLDCAEVAEGPLAAALSEAMAFMGFGAGWLDVAFLDSDSDLAKQIIKVGLVFNLPEPAQTAQPKPPGMDPDAPPKLR